MDHHIHIGAIPLLMGIMHGLEPSHSLATTGAFTLGNRLSFQQCFSVGFAVAAGHFLVTAILAVLVAAGIATGASGFGISFQYLSGTLLILLGATIVYREMSQKMPHCECCASGGVGETASGNMQMRSGIAALAGASVLPCFVSIGSVIPMLQGGSVFWAFIGVFLFALGMGISSSSIALLTSSGARLLESHGFSETLMRHARTISGYALIAVGGLYFFG